MIDVNNIVNPRWVDSKKSIVEFQVVNEDGSHKNLTFHVPEQRGMNMFWDYIQDNFDLSKMDEELKTAEERWRANQKYMEIKHDADREAREMSELFKTKSAMFDLPWIQEGPSEVKTAIRRAQNKAVVESIVAAELYKHIYVDGNKYNDVLDKLDDIIYGDEDDNGDDTL